MLITPNIKLLAIAAATSVLIAACGGGDSDPAPVDPTDTAATDTATPSGGTDNGNTTDTATPTDTSDSSATDTDTDANTGDNTDDNTDAGDTTEPVDAVFSVGDGGSTNTPLQTGQSNTVTVELRAASGDALAGKRDVRVDIVENVQPKAAFANGDKSQTITFTDGIGQINITPDAGETSITLLLTDIASGKTFVLTLSAEAPAPEGIGGAGDETEPAAAVIRNVDGAIGEPVLKAGQPNVVEIALQTEDGQTLQDERTVRAEIIAGGSNTSSGRNINSPGVAGSGRNSVGEPCTAADIQFGRCIGGNSGRTNNTSTNNTSTNNTNTNSSGRNINSPGVAGGGRNSVGEPCTAADIQFGRCKRGDAADEKAAFADGGKSQDITFTNGIGSVAITPDARETGVTLRLTDLASNKIFTLALTVTSDSSSDTTDTGTTDTGTTDTGTTDTGRDINSSGVAGGGRNSVGEECTPLDRIFGRCPGGNVNTGVNGNTAPTDTNPGNGFVITCTSMTNCTPENNNNSNNSNSPVAPGTAGTANNLPATNGNPNDNTQQQPSSAAPGTAGAIPGNNNG